MDGTRFDTLTRSLTNTRTRRGMLGSLLTGALALVGQAWPDVADAAGGCKPKCDECKQCKKGKCRNSRRGKPCRKGTCRNGRCIAICADRIKNGKETDVDCGGGTCPRCAVGKTCSSRADCATALCVGNTCTQCAQPTDCGFEADGVTNCFCITTNANERVCTNQTGRFVDAGTCADCRAPEQCQPLMMGGVICYPPCGS